MPEPLSLLSASLSAFAGAKLSFFAAATLMVCPVARLRDSRSGASFTFNLPKLGSTSLLPRPPPQFDDCFSLELG